MERGGRSDPGHVTGGGGEGEGGGWVLVEARLQGGAPWGFTLQGGLEHGEPLVISKVEDGGKAERPLRVGDQLVVINEVELTGSRKEAVALVKGSHKTLQLTVRREFGDGYIEDFVSSPTPSLQQTPLSRNRSGSISVVQLRVADGRTEPASRPHSWHSTKLGDCQQELDQRPMDTMSSSWHHNCHASASTMDLTGGFDSGGSYLRKSPDQYSSRGSMESLDPPLSSQLHSGSQQYHPLGHHGHGGPHPAYSSCHQLSSSRSSSSIDHLHSKRDSAYSSFSTSSSTPDYLAAMPSFSPERSYSLETVPQRGRELQQVDTRYIQTVYDREPSPPHRRDLSAASVGPQHSGESRGGGALRPAPSQDHQGSVAGAHYNETCRSSSDGGTASNRHSVGSLWGPATSCRSYGAPVPPRRSDSYTALRNHDRPNSWSSLEHARSLRSLQKGSWHHSSGPVASGAGKGSYSTEGQLHTVIEKSPESSPTTKPRQGGGFLPPPSAAGPPFVPAGLTPQSSRIMYPVPQSEPHYAQAPGPNPNLGPARVYPGLARESRPQQQELRAVEGGVGGATESERGGRPTTENGYSNSFDTTTDSAQLRTRANEVERSGEQSSSHKEPLAFSRPAHADSPCGPFLPSQPQPPKKPASSVQPPAGHSGDPAALQYKHWDPRSQGKEHPLTRLENALAEVQQCSCPDAVDSASGHDHSGFNSSSRGPVRSLSVLEKVSRFERREHAGKQRSQSTSTSYNKPTHLRMTEKGRSSPCGAEDLRHMLERSTKGSKAHRTMSFRRGSGEQAQHRTADPSSALQRSRSTFHVDASVDRGGSKDFPWRQEVQEMLGPVQDMPANRSYRNFLKEAQSKVLRSTSFRRKDLSSSVSDPPAAAPPPQPPPVPAKCQSLERKGPKTMPKPQGAAVTAQSAPSVASPHAPKERHVVSSDVRGPSPPALPTLPPVGPPAALPRICGRRRLTADQKKRSYSEPENLNEVGVSDAETVALFRRGGETSVADRRKVFELPASHAGCPVARPDLRQVQQDALAEYVERKRGGRRDEGGYRSGRRPRSAYLGPESSNHSESFSLSSTSSLLSLPDAGLDHSFVAGETRPFALVHSEAKQQIMRSNVFYPGRVTAPRTPANPPTGSPHSYPREAQVCHQQAHVPVFSRTNQSVIGHLSPGHDRQGADVQPNTGVSKQPHRALLRASSASTDSLLDLSGQSRNAVQHQRSRSSPTAEWLNQDLVRSDVGIFGNFISKPGPCKQVADSPSDGRLQRGSASPQPTHIGVNTVQPAEPSQGNSQTPTPRKERQRGNDRQRAQSTSALAASVGLPCPFSPPGTSEGFRVDWQATENLDAIMFPLTGFGDGKDAGATGNSKTLAAGRRLGPSVLQDASVDTSRGGAFGSGTERGHAAEKATPGPSTQTACGQLEPLPSRDDGQKDVSPAVLSHLSLPQHLDSLQISESGFCHSTDQLQALEPATDKPMPEDCDDVFLHSPPGSPSFLLPNQQIIPEGFLPPPLPPPPLPPPPPPPPPMVLEQGAEQQTMESSESTPLATDRFLQSSPASARPAAPSPSLPRSASSNKPLGSVIAPSKATGHHLNLEYQPLLRREKTLEEQRVETLCRQLVLQDPSLEPILDTWGVESTVEIMDQIFSNCKLTCKQKWQERSYPQVDGSIQDGLCVPAQINEPDGRTDANFDEDEKDINTRKVELCEALRSSIAALQREKEALAEAQRRHQVLGASVETLVQEHLRPNEKDKFSMFIGDLERIVNLLLSLCGRLSRINRALLSLEKGQLSAEEAEEERESLQHKRSVLLRQTEDACELKENLDRRQRAVHAILSGYLTGPQLQDYRRFVCAKPSLLVRQRHLDDLTRQEEELLAHLVDGLPAEVAAGRGWPAGDLPAFLGAAARCSSHSPLPLPTPITPGIVHSVRSTTVTSL